MENTLFEILLIEDDPTVARMIVGMLAESRREKFSVQHVRYLAEGLSLLETRGFDLILVDMGLPDSRGLETALAVRAHSKLTPIVILTVPDDEDTALKSLQMDIQDYLVKGEISRSLLVRSIRYAIQRKRSSEELRESERFASFMLNLPAAAWMKDMQGRYVYANAEAERVFSMPLTALLGKTGSDVFPPETARQFGENDYRVFSEGGRLQTTEVFRQADGIDHHSIVNKFAVNGPDGRPAYVAGVAFDITGLKRAEEALRESEEKFSKIFDTAPVGMTISSLADGRFVDINREGERLSGYRRDEVIGRTALEFDVWKDPDERGRMIEEIQDEGLVRDREMTFRNKGGNVLLGVFSSAVISIGGKKHLLSIVSDITERKRTEAEMQRLASFPLMNPNPILEMDTAGRLIFVNPAAKEILEKAGYGDDANPFIPEDFPAVFKNLLDEKTHHVFREVEVDGRYFEELIFLTPHMKTARIYTMDITRRKQAEQERERLLLQLEAILNSINEGVVVSDLEGNVLAMNREALALHEIECVEDVRHPLSEYQETFELFDLAGRPVPFEEWPLLRALRGERYVDYEVRVHRRDTGRAWIASYSGSPVYNSAGEYILAVITVRDITERKRMEQALLDSEMHYRNSEERLRFASTAADIGMWHWDLVNNELTWSERCKELFGYPPDYPMTYEAFLRAIHEEERQCIDEAVQKSLLEKTDYSVVMRVVLPDGHVRWVMNKGRGFYDDQGKPVRMHGIAMDITERRRAEEEIKRLNTDLAARAFELEIANRELEAFNYTVAHDLRKPLTVVNGYCQALGELCGSKLDETCNGYLREAYEGTLRMNRLIDALLNFSRLAHVEPRRESVDLSAMAHVAAAELKLAEPERRVGFQIADGVSTDGDAALLRVVLDNLLGNAWKYTGTREEAVIEFGVTEFDGQPACFIRDNGTGFDMAYADKLFTPFQRLAGAEECKGFGIGLATVERIIRHHGGRIWAAGEPGKGATFYFTLQS